ncbi:MAG TPA: response regulator [Candidatus Polarisedimenticolaceae bacterium]|nr:response regulator [Candidatus Polarisedimenticolaceae bacterium]
MKVLVVDDSPDAAEVLALQLAHEGYTTSYALDGATALRTAATFMPEVALLDLGMPEMDGCELARRLRRMPGLENVHLVAITGFKQPSYRRKSAEAGFEEHLIKPVDLAEVKSAIARVTGEE